MSDSYINLTAPIHAATKDGKALDAREVFMDGDQETLQEIGEKTHQLENAVKDISVSGGASTANAVSYDNGNSGMTAINAQAAIDEIIAKNKSDVDSLNAKDSAQDVEIGKKANKDDVDSELAKKFDKESIVQELGDAEDKVVSQFALPFREVESPEFLHCLVDSEDHFLFGIQLDGSVEWGKGIPSPIRKKFQEIINQSQQDKADLTTAINTAKEEISASLKQYKEATDVTLADLKENKVDKEEGKSLIEDEVKEHFSVIENEEWLCAMTDAEDRILFGIYRESGKPYYPLNDMYHVEQNEEFFAVWLDAENHVLLGIRRDGQIIGEIHAVNSLKEVISNLQDEVKALQDKLEEQNNAIATNQGDINTIKENAATIQEKINTIETNLQEFLGVFSLQDNPEYLAVETDADGRMLATTNLDGSHYSRNLQSETIDAKVDKEDGKSLINSDVADSQSTIEDPEGRMEIITDADGKVLSERKQDGEKHEVKMDIDNLKVSNINLQGNSVNNIQEALIGNGFEVKTPTDWSKDGFVQIPIPRCAKVNLVTDIMPTSKSGMGTVGKTCDIPCYMEFWDMQGNYFKVPILLSAQGNSSMMFVKKNLAIDMFTDEQRSNSFVVKFGDWVSQDSYHLKAYYTDFFRGVGAVSYALYEQMVKTKGIDKDRPYKTLYTSKYGDVDLGLSYSESSLDYNLDTGAKCFPQGFPVIVFQNGEFYGIYSWQLKKHRDNMHQDKKTAEHIHLDGTIDESTMFGGVINWSAFEVRNPKSLYMQEKHTVRGEETLSYNGDYPYEIMGEDSELYDVSNKDMKRCATVKKYIVDFSNRISELKNAVTENKSEAEIKAIFEKYFDVSNLVDYILETNIGSDNDGYSKNWQWTTYDGVKWFVNPYDHDCIFGSHHLGVYITSPLHHLLGNTKATPIGWIYTYYMQELKDRWKELRSVGIFDTSNIMSLLTDWCARIGFNAYQDEYKKWSESPCCRQSYINDKYWECNYDYYIGNWSSTSKYVKDISIIKGSDGKVYLCIVDNSINIDPTTDNGNNWKDITYNSNTIYNDGDIVAYGKKNYYKFVCKQTCDNQPPITKFYNLQPYELGHFDSLYRVQKWIETQISNIDKLLEYK